MFDILISIAFFAFAVSVKGGLLGKIFTNWNRTVNTYKKLLDATIEVTKDEWHRKDYASAIKEGWLIPYYAFMKWFIDGSVISLFLVFFYVWATATLPVAAVFALGWILLWSSMGEEAGAAGDYIEAWGPYMTASIVEPDRTRYPFGRSYGVKKGIQYGCFGGAVMSMAVGSWCILFAAATFPLCYYLGNSYLRWRTDGVQRGWQYSEPLWGGVIGVGYAFAQLGWLPLQSVFTF